MPTKVKALQPAYPDQVAYGYGRVSHKKSFDKGESLPAQHTRIQLYYEANLKTQGVQWGGTIDDKRNVSAYKVPFHARPAGAELIAKMKPGDHLIFDRVDRIWRSMTDFVNLMELFKRKDIVVHIVNFLGSSIQNNTPMGGLQLKQLVMLAELESEIKSERLKEAVAIRRKQGRRVACFVPPGCKVVHIEVHGQTIKQLEWCTKERALMAEIVRLKDAEVLTWEQCWDKIESFRARIYGVPERPVEEQKANRKTGWPRLYNYETAYRYLKVRDPSEIPRKEIIKEAARQYRRCRTLLKHQNSKIEEITAETLRSVS